MGSVPGGGVQSTSFASSSSSTAVTSRFAKRFRGVRRSTGDEGRRDHDVARQGLLVGDAVDEHLERGAGSTLDVTAHWFEALTRKREFDTMRSFSPMGRFANENGIHHERREDEDARDARARTPRHPGLPFHERLAVVERMLKEGRLRALETYRPKTDAPNNGQLSARTMAILGLERCAAPTTLRDSAARPTPKPSSSRSTRRDVWRGQTPFEDSLDLKSAVQPESAGR